MRVFSLLFAVLWLGPAVEVAASPEAPTRPNIVLFLVDDLGWADLGCFGSDFYRTPRIDRLARDGMLFTDAYASAPVCSPTRAALQSGLYPARLRITDWIPGVRYPHARLRVPDFTQELPLEITTIAEALRPAGYATLHVGKWHLGDEPFYPRAQGFDVNIGGHSKGAPATYFHPYQSKPDAAVDWSVRNLPPGGQDGDYLTDRLTDEAIRLIEQHRDRPFFLHLSFYTVHTPIEGKPDLVEQYRARKKPELKQQNAAYAAMVHNLDENVGRVLETLDALDLAGNTIVIFTSDNGGVTGITNNHPLRAGKGFLYEGGIRVPMIVRWPGVVTPNRQSDTVVTSIDLLPTIVEMAGVAAATDEDRSIDGLSLVPQLRDPAARWDREAVFWHYPHYHTPKRPPTGAVRAGDWKLIEFYEDGRVELYDLRSDPGEKHDLAGEHRERAAALQRRLHEWLVETGAQMPTINADFDPARPFRAGYAAWGAKTPVATAPAPRPIESDSAP
ncbi:MAG: sulfatase [Planctomycetota bacterium]|jgi:arylsulfatase A-like enzyme